MLHPQRDSDNSKAKECAETYVCKADFNAAKHYPDDVHENRQTSHVSGVAGHVVSEWTECESCHLEQLHSERNSDDRYAEYYTHDCVVEADKKASADNPDKIS